jgi:hypothetical protein
MVQYIVIVCFFMDNNSVELFEFPIIQIHILTEEHRLRVFENRVLRRIFGPKRDEETGGWRKLHNEKLHNLYSSPSIITDGRAIAEAVSRWLPTAAARVRARVWQVGFVVDKVALGQVFSHKPSWRGGDGEGLSI